MILAGKRLSDNKAKSIMLEGTHEFIQVCLQAAGELNCRIVLVGGAVRDYLAKRAISDYDFVADTDDKELVKVLARKIAEKSSGAFVELDAERGFFRIARKEVHADIATRVGDSLLEDAFSRDFTVNAIYKDIADDKYFDPCGGIADLRDNVLRTVSPESLVRDPLRAIRAWRMICKYNMRYNGELEKQVREASAKLDKVASERITEELFCCLGCNIVSHWDFAHTNGILEALFPECKGAFANVRLALSELDKAIAALQQNVRILTEERLGKVMAAQRTMRQNLRLAVILGAGYADGCGADSAGEAVSASACDGDAGNAEGARFADGCQQGLTWLETACENFSLSRREKKFLAKVVPNCAEPVRLYAQKQPLRYWNALFRRNEYVPELMLCAAALHAAESFTPCGTHATAAAYGELAPAMPESASLTPDTPKPAPISQAPPSVPPAQAPNVPAPASHCALHSHLPPSVPPAQVSAGVQPSPASVLQNAAAQQYQLRVKQLFENGDFFTFVIFMIGDFFQEGQVCQPNIPYTGADLAEKYCLSGEAIRKILDELAGISAERGGLSAKDAEEYISVIMNR